jgi:large subunit ribosomal protein L1
MPSPKTGTVTPDVETAVREYAAGKMEYRSDAGGNIHLRIGKASFAVEDLKANVEAVIDRMLKVKPASARGQYLKSVYVSGCQTPSVRVEVAS